MKSLWFLVSLIFLVSNASAYGPGKQVKHLVKVQMPNDLVLLVETEKFKSDSIAISGSNVDVSIDFNKETIRLEGTGSMVFQGHKVKFSVREIEMPGVVTTNKLSVDGKDLVPNGRRYLLPLNGSLLELHEKTFE